MVAIAGSLALAAVMPACGEDEGNDGTAEALAPPVDATALLDYVPADRSGVRLVDLAAAREELGLPADADASDLGGGDAQSHLGAAASAVIPYLSLPRTRPIEDAIDHGAITAAAGNVVHGGPGMTALATSQSLDDIAVTLVTEGYEREGDLLVSDSSFVAGSYGVIADTGDGVIVLGYERGTVKRAIEDSPGEGNPARLLLEEVGGVTRGAVAPARLDCIDGIAAGQSADLRSGEILIEVRGEAAAQRFRLPDALTLPEFEFGKPDVDGRALTAKVGVDPQSGMLNGPISLLSTALAPGEIYAC
jgi:hypothetical protein